MGGVDSLLALVPVLDKKYFVRMIWERGAIGASLKAAENFGYGIIGCGWVAGAHAWGVRALAGSGVRLVAVSDLDHVRAAELARRFGVQHVDEDYRALLAREDVHAVSICLPDFLHEEVTIAAAAAGKHILCEKPLANNPASAARMIDACRRAGVQLGVVFNHRYAPDNIRVRAMLGNGALGRVLIGNVIHSSALTGDPDNVSAWRGRRGLAAGGILTTQAIHFLDLLLWFAGPAVSAKAWTDRLVRTNQDYEDTAALALRHRSGALSTLVTTNGSPITDDFTGTRIEIQGTAGYLTLQGDRLETWYSADQQIPPQPQLPEPPAGSEEIVFGTGHVHLVSDFVRAVMIGARPPVPAEDGYHLMEVLDAAYRSASDGGDVTIADVAGSYADQVDARLLLSGRAAPVM